jgi:hypothetical protein
VLALIDYEAQQCSGCGGFLPETADPDASYEAKPPGQCYRCKALKKQQKEYADQPGADSLRIWPVVPIKR